MPTRVAARKVIGGSVDIIRSGLVGFWDCVAGADPQTVYDLSGNGNHAYFGTDPAIADTQDPQFNTYGLTFGGDDFAQSNAFSAGSLTGDFTISAVWKAPTASVSGTVFGFGKVGANEYMVLQENRSTISALARSAHTSDTTATPASVACALGSVVAATFKKSGTIFILTNDLTGVSSVTPATPNVDQFSGPLVFSFGRLLRASISSYYSYDLYAAAAYNRCLSSDEHVLRNRLFFQALIRPRGLIIGASAP